MTDDTRARELLAPCPFCGITIDHDGECWLLHPANDCILEGSEFGDARKTLAENVTTWNTRALASPQDVGVERTALLSAVLDLEDAVENDAAYQADPASSAETLQAVAQSRLEAREAVVAALASAPAQPEQESIAVRRIDENGLPVYTTAAQPVDEDAKYQLAREVLLKAVRYYRPKYPYVDLPITISPAEALRAILATRPSAYIKGMEDAAKEADRFNPLIGNAIRNLIHSSQGGAGK